MGAPVGITALIEFRPVCCREIGTGKKAPGFPLTFANERFGFPTKSFGGSDVSLLNPNHRAFSLPCDSNTPSGSEVSLLLLASSVSRATRLSSEGSDTSSLSPSFSVTSEPSFDSEGSEASLFWLTFNVSSEVRLSSEGSDTSSLSPSFSVTSEPSFDSEGSDAS